MDKMCEYETDVDEVCGATDNLMRLQAKVAYTRSLLSDVTKTQNLDVLVCEEHFIAITTDTRFVTAIYSAKKVS